MKAPQAMLLSKREDPWDDDRYIFEPKIDGHRLLLTLSGGVVRLHTRHGNNVTDRYPELHSVPVSVEDIVLDGEVAYLNPATGQIEFETVMDLPQNQERLGERSEVRRTRIYPVRGSEYCCERYSE